MLFSDGRPSTCCSGAGTTTTRLRQITISTTPGARSGEGFRQLAVFPLHPLGLRQLPGNRLFWHKMAVRRYPRLVEQHEALLEEPRHLTHPTRAEPAS